ncbi:signal peptide protein [Candidatus Magnetomorum sp. HK-1]|nr:signal peptide protein [Candidatus Magnetomorum sp. HK-1]
MQIDIHFYGTYCLARAAGITAETAHTIATASQFVNDATSIKSVLIENQRCFRPVRTSFKGLPQPYHERDAWRCWIPFHFLPGNTPEVGSFEEKIMCQKNSLIAQKVALFALDEQHHDIRPYIIGITAHAYADTFSHYGFSGLPHKHNSIQADSIILDKNHQDTIADYLTARSDNFKDKYASNETHLPIGHAQAATYPDRPYLKWRLKYVYKGLRAEGLVWRDNTADYMEACECLFYFFLEYAKKYSDACDPKGPKKWADISPVIRFILGVEGPCDLRIPVWKRNLSAGVFGDLTPVDQQLQYDSRRWQLNRAIWESEETGEPIDHSNAYLFFKAARCYRRFILEELLVETGLLV